MTDRDDKSDTPGKQTPKSASSHLDPRVAALVRMLARRAAERDFAEIVRRHRGMRLNPNGKDPLT